MTNQEIIQALKENEKPFGLMDKELQEKAKNIKRGNFQCYQTIAGVWKDSYVMTGDAGTDFDLVFTYRLRPDYQEEPERIELEIHTHAIGGMNALGCVVGCQPIAYTNCPAFSPKEGYRFIGYRYDIPSNPPVYLRSEPVMYMDRYNHTLRAPQENCKAVYPTHAVYQKEAQCS
jgi:hypothetical protein